MKINRAQYELYKSKLELRTLKSKSPEKESHFSSNPYLKQEPTKPVFKANQQSHSRNQQQQPIQPHQPLQLQDPHSLSFRKDQSNTQSERSFGPEHSYTIGPNITQTTNYFFQTTQNMQRVSPFNKRDSSPLTLPQLPSQKTNQSAYMQMKGSEASISSEAYSREGSKIGGVFQGWRESEERGAMSVIEELGKRQELVKVRKVLSKEMDQILKKKKGRNKRRLYYINPGGEVVKETDGDYSPIQDRSKDDIYKYFRPPYKQFSTSKAKKRSIKDSLSQKLKLNSTTNDTESKKDLEFIFRHSTILNDLQLKKDKEEEEEENSCHCHSYLNYRDHSPFVKAHLRIKQSLNNPNNFQVTNLQSIKKKLLNSLHTNTHMQIEKRREKIVKDTSPVVPSFIPDEEHQGTSRFEVILAESSRNQRQMVLGGSSHSKQMQFRSTEQSYLSKMSMISFLNKKIPQNYYRNFRLNRIRERVEEEYEECKCKEHMEEEEQKRFSSQSNSPEQKKTFKKKVQEASKVLNQPYIPCRRTCSTIHGKGERHKLKNLFQNSSTGRLLVIKKKLRVPQQKRPKSGNDHDPYKESLQEIDWEKSELFQEIRGLKKQEVGHKEDIYDETEVKYVFSLVKKSVDEREVIPKEERKEIFDKAMRTLKYEMNKLLLHKTFLSIQKNYFENGESKNADNIIKLLLRCKNMYEAQQDVRTILKSIMKRGALNEQLKRNNDDEKDQLIKQINFMAKRIINDIERLKKEHQNLKRPFIFGGLDYLYYLRDKV